MNAFRLTSALLLVLSAALQSNTVAQDGHTIVLDMSAEMEQPQRSTAAGLRRAGYPECLAPWARFTYGRPYCGYFVGGGAALYGRNPTHLRGERRVANEGTWGVDYNPWYSRVRLQWFHGLRRQDGEGQYKADRRNNPLIPLFFR
ncbi:MAG: hypothetical protein HON53_03690 [Planctomycetaceae bacterium]|jgi:hypothetical protein|nr:hypothetical protein [Planctomycetaceae bacterium]MBT6158248.1 hypothetical protein [Planctomycetaceae bacterium]MBT6487569.1 hypothetical protein [Planctomycetaceae bacterium]MBT6493227.1 hypothetical protein [Planctomycetaceae bacterium]